MSPYHTHTHERRREAEEVNAESGGREIKEKEERWWGRTSQSWYERSAKARSVFLFLVTKSPFILNCEEERTDRGSTGDATEKRGARCS